MEPSRLKLDADLLRVASFTTEASAGTSAAGGATVTEPILLTTWITAAIC